MILALLLTTSRAGILSLLIILPGLIFILNAKIGTKKIIAVFIILILLVSFFIFSIGDGSVRERLDTLTFPLKAYGARLTFIQDSTKIIKEFFLFGTGLGTFGDIYQKYKSFQYHYEVRVGFAHNEPLQVLVETGLLGLLL